MTSLGYSLISEEHGPTELVDNGSRAEEAGFEFAFVSDHFHPWTSRQGNAPFVWSTLGGLARETDRLRVGTAVTCPIVRIHPAIVAQAAATAGEMFDERFFLGVGTGENLNEHVVGERWPPHDVRLEMLVEAVEVIRSLLEGGTRSHHGEHFTVENARLYTLPDDPPSIHVAASGMQTAAVAGRIGDGLISTAPERQAVEQFQDAADDEDAPKYGQVTVCYAETEQEARETAHEWWPNAAVPGELGQILPTPAHFEQAATQVTEDDVAEKVVCGPDPQDHIDQIRAFVDAGFDHVSVHQVGPNQDAFFEFYEDEVLPAID